MFIWSDDYSKEYRHFKLRNRCPACGASQGGFLRLVKSDGTKLPTISFQLDPDAHVECVRCHTKFSVFSSNVNQKESVEFSILELTETNRTEESIGTEHRVIDNSASSISLTRRFTIAKEWTQACNIEQENVKKNIGEFGFETGAVAKIAFSVEEILITRYSTTTETRRSYSEEVSVNVPAKTKVRISFHWKCLWQRGVIKVQTQNGSEILLPYKIATGITFDQTQTDESSEK